VIASKLMSDAVIIQQQLEQAAAAARQAEMLAGKAIDPADIYDESGRLDIMKQREVMKVLDAREQLPALKQTIQALQERSVQTEQQLSAQRFRDFQEAHPQYRTSVDVVEAAALKREGRLAGPDFNRLYEMVEIMKAASASGVDPEQVYRFKKDARQLSVTPTASTEQSRETALPRFTKGSPDTEKLIARLQAKRAQFQGAAGGGGAARVSPLTPKQQATNVISASARAAMGVAGPSSVMDDAGY
jgi:hypothetical protein